MAELQVNPTRMELRKIRNKLKVAEKGYELLKDKTNELIRQFYAILKENKDLRNEIEKQFQSILVQFGKAKAYISDEELSLLFSMPSCAYEIECTKENLLNMLVPKLEVKEITLDKHLPYSPIDTTSEMDFCVKRFYELTPKIYKLAEIEKTSYILVNEIEKAKRRVNALENILLPTYRKTISRIQSKLSENERSNTSRLMKVKDILSNNDK